MKKSILCIIVMLWCQFSVGQQTYTVTEGQLYCISPAKGIVIKKGSRYYTLEIEVDFEGKQEIMKSVLKPIKKNEAEALSKQENSISYDQIDGRYDFKKLQELQFTYTEDDTNMTSYEIRKFRQFNPGYFAIFAIKQENHTVNTYLKEWLPCIFIQFDQKRILYTYDNVTLYLIPTPNKIQLFGLHDPSVLELKVEKMALTKDEIYAFSQNAFAELNKNYFRIDTLPNKKVQLKNRFNEILISKNYDAIDLRGTSIIGYTGKTMDLYNLALKKLNQDPLKAVNFNPWSIQMIENNTLKTIDRTGQELKTKFNYPFHLVYEPTTKEYFYELVITKRNDNFTLKMRNLDHIAHEDQYTVSDSISLQNTSEILEICLKNKMKDTVKSSVDFSIYNRPYQKGRISMHVPFDDVIVTFLRKDGTFGINYLHYFLKPENKNQYFEDDKPFTGYQKVQSIVYKAPFYEIKKNDLFLLYPIQKEFRYKKIADFQGYFARYERTNGEKGWLDFKGNEYRDD